MYHHNLDPRVNLVPVEMMVHLDYLVLRATVASQALLDCLDHQVLLDKR